MAKEPIVFMNCSEIEDILKKEKEKAFTGSTFLDLKPPYVVEVIAKPYPTEYKTQVLEV